MTPFPRLAGLNRSLLTTQWSTFTVAVTMLFSLQHPFNFNVEISVSSRSCRYQDLAGFRPRMEPKSSGAPASVHLNLALPKHPLKVGRYAQHWTFRHQDEFSYQRGYESIGMSCQKVKLDMKPSAVAITDLKPYLVSVKSSIFVK